MFFSIIVPCYNEEKYLDGLFRSIERAADGHCEYEIILVDNGSVDRSVSIARSNNVKVLVDPEANISKLRNIGGKEARGDILAFLDADCLPQAGWLSEASKYGEREEVGLFGCIPRPAKNATWVERCWVESISPVGVRETNFICSANMFIKKDAFFKVGGFDEELVTGEDYDMCQRVIRAGFKIVYDDQLTSIHLRYPKTLFQRFRKELWYGKETLTILKGQPFYRPFWASMLFGGCLCLAVFFLFMGNTVNFYWLLCACLLIASVCAWSKLSVTRKYKYFFQLIVLFIVYLSARCCSICILPWRR